MNISIDFEVFQCLTARLENDQEDYNEVIRRLLSLPASDIAFQTGEFDAPSLPVPSQNALAPQAGGAWFSNVYLPNGTLFRATYKGKSYRAWINSSQWVDELGKIRTSPSDAAKAITCNNVNGWRFWYAKRPGDEDWQRMDALKK